MEAPSRDFLRNLLLTLSWTYLLGIAVALYGCFGDGDPGAMFDPEPGEV